MNLEQEMYQVMAALYTSGIPIDFKGAMVLHAFLYENGFTDTAVRPTRDIDANWLSDIPPTMEYIVSSIQSVLDQNQIPLHVKPFRDYGPGKSAGIDFCSQTSGNTVFTMDMDINRPEAGTRLYTVSQFQFRGIVVEQMLADKISAVSTEKVFRRVKDILDLYYLSLCFRLDASHIRDVLSKTHRELSSFDGFLNHVPEIEHAYSKFRFAGNVEKPAFEQVYTCAKDYIAVFLPGGA